MSWSQIGFLLLATGMVIVFLDSAIPWRSASQAFASLQPAFIPVAFESNSGLLRVGMPGFVTHEPNLSFSVAWVLEFRIRFLF